ncbi:hypothetical protein [Pseudoteredinibacter isoporae]|uniref:Uncharacterized protein n=1 Tax=Pseudoteredinibacter isoporae TaxID=570281 RepID=A0A7X0MXI9_9GAMM|nr:hypothetical protein [Pseudoteredinibacter isoporae]MBB6523816.1 hypothetical protein [Pseudoteredinibacter isoporae]NHO89336.1 hypothetical protein [Pseudoteredinibacter isoporae]NIB22443.1 hypothetical protein [Pseudoteredinibacter isoporae]
MEFHAVFMDVTTGEVVYGVREVSTADQAESHNTQQRCWLLSGECLRGPTSDGVYLTPRRAYQLLTESNEMEDLGEGDHQLNLFSNQ